MAESRLVRFNRGAGQAHTSVQPRLAVFVEQAPVLLATGIDILDQIFIAQFNVIAGRVGCWFGHLVVVRIDPVGLAVGLS